MCSVTPSSRNTVAAIPSRSSTSARSTFSVPENAVPVCSFPIRAARFRTSCIRGEDGTSCILESFRGNFGVDDALYAQDASSGLSAKTTPFPADWLVEGEFARLDRDGEPVLARRQGAAPGVVVCAVRVVGAVEIKLETAVAKRLRL